VPGKRANGEGYVTRTKNGKWRGQLMDGYTDEGKRKIISFTADTKAELLQKIREYKEARQSVKNALPVTFGQWADQWYADYKPQVARSTYSGYRFTLKLLKEAFGDRPIAEILPMDISAFLNLLLEEGWSQSKISKCRAMLIQIFDAAEQNQLIPRNPARSVKPFRRDWMEELAHGNKKDAFTEEEVEILFRELPDDFLGNSIRLLLVTGMRVQELLALTAKDIASDGSTIDINKAVKMVDGKPEIGPPKSRNSVRVIPVPKEYRHLAVYLREHGGRIFLWQSSKIGEPCTIEHFRNIFRSAIKNLPVRKLTPHCCRHTYITMLQKRGVPMETISRLAGHSNLATTGTYLHQDLDTLAQAVEKLGKASESY